MTTDRRCVVKSGLQPLTMQFEVDIDLRVYSDDFPI
jgi:hypothetical protein